MKLKFHSIGLIPPEADLMVENAHIARHDLILENSTSWYIDSIAMVRNDDNRTLYLRFIKITN